MTDYKEVRTRKYKRSELVALSERIARESGEEWVRADNVERYNERIGARRRGLLRLFAFIFNERPLLGFILTVIFFLGVSVPIAICFSKIALIIVGAGALIGVYLGSQVYVSSFTGCRACSGFRTCREVYSHPIEHTDSIERRSLNGRRATVRVREELAFVVMECRKCKGRKIEILRKSEERVVDP